MREYKIHTLPNGIRVVHNLVTTSKIVHCGLMLDVGSRDETLANQGIAHFWEHMAFKGTRKRKSFHISSRLESVGGELNAFTDKEKICFFASLRDEYFERAVDLLADITFHSVFPKPQLEKERKVILEEMSMYYDDPDGALQDEFDALATVQGKKVHKIRYYYLNGGITYEIDVFQDDLAGLILVDVEFSSNEAKSDFVAPSWFGADVTQEKFVAGGVLCRKSYGDLELELKRFGYQKFVI